MTNLLNYEFVIKISVDKVTINLNVTVYSDSLRIQ